MEIKKYIIFVPIANQMKFIENILYHRNYKVIMGMV